jgi:hypothetical protein
MRIAWNSTLAPFALDTASLPEKKVLMNSARIGLLVCLLAALPCLALTGGPGMPEYMQFEESSNDNLVDPNTGNLTFTIPLVDVPGPEGGYQVPLSYHSGIQHDQEATWVGLGWSLNAGSVNRMIRGTPDDYMNGLSTTQNIGSASADYISIGMGVGPIGMSMTWEINRGKYMGTEGVFSLAGLLSTINAGLKAGGGPGLFDGNPGAQFLANHFDVQLSSEGLSVSAGLSSNETGSLSSISMGTNGHTSIGIGGILNVASSGLSVGAAAQSGHGTGTLTTYGGVSFLYPIGLAWVSITPPYGWRWELNETFSDRNFGYLWQGGRVSGVVPRRPDEGTPKNERLKFGSDLVPSGDFYAVSAGGLEGTFQPHFSAPYSGYAGKFPTLQDGDPAADGQGMHPVNPANFSDITFRMDGDMGRNLLHVPTASPDQISPYQAPDMVQKQYGSYRIDPVFESDGTIPDVIRPTLKGFRIRDSQGKVYEYLQPVKSLLTTELTSTDPNTISNSRIVHILYDPYAVSWLLTAIKGPDYVSIAHSD